MLLSDARVQQTLQERYVLCWQSVRPVPKVTIDFGGGRVLERTLKGNTAFYLCRPDGRVVDIFPGVYTPTDFLRELAAADPLVGMSDQEVLAWHWFKSPVPLAGGPPQGITASKMVVESPLLEALEAPQHDGATPGSGAFARYAATLHDLSDVPRSRREVMARIPAGQGSPGERMVAEDSRRNVRLVRPGVHLLLGSGLPTPAECRSAVFQGPAGRRPRRSLSGPRRLRHPRHSLGPMPLN